MSYRVKAEASGRIVDRDEGYEVARVEPACVNRATVMLNRAWQLNASVRYRYPDAEQDDGLPGPCDAYWEQPYRYAPTGRAPTAVEGLKLVSCYEYQACESPAWEGSEAQRFCQALRHRLIGNLPGYDEAPWEWLA